MSQSYSKCIILLLMKDYVLRNIFKLRFFLPNLIEVCSFCYQIKNQINMAKSDKKKTSVIMTLRLYKLSAKQFNLLMKKKTWAKFFLLLWISVGSGTNQIARIFWCLSNNVSITNVETKNLVFYSWVENETERGSTEIWSALHNFLLKSIWPENCSLLRLFCDGCSKQEF